MKEFYKNIRQKRIELNMTQTDLAKKVGYSDKSMIARIERGDIDLPQSKIMLFADALDMTPCSLMGWNEYDSMELDKTRNDILDLKRYLDDMKDAGASDPEAEHHLELLQGHLQELFEYTGMVTPNYMQRLSETEATLLDIFRQMSKDRQALLLAQADLLLKVGQ